LIEADFLLIQLGPIDDGPFLSKAGLHTPITHLDELLELETKDVVIELRGKEAVSPQSCIRARLKRS
jgi:hypothetical protein